MPLAWDWRSANAAVQLDPLPQALRLIGPEQIPASAMVGVTATVPTAKNAMTAVAARASKTELPMTFFFVLISGSPFLLSPRVVEFRYQSGSPDRFSEAMGGAVLPGEIPA
jgi:hypothetical protein